MLESKITRVYDTTVEDKHLKCGNCGNIIGEVSNKKIDMNSSAFTYTGTKIEK